MNEENSLAAENPFRKLDKKRFQPLEAKKKERTAKKKAAPSGDADAALSFYSEFGSSPSDDKEARAFLAAVSGVTKLGAAPKKTPPKQPAPASLGHPVLAEDSVRETKRSLKAKKKMSVPAQETVSSAPEEREIQVEDNVFFNAMQDVTPLSGKGRAVVAEAPAPVAPVQEAVNPLQDFMDGKLEFALAFTDEYVEGHVVGLDLMTVGKLQAGQFSPESHLDLHGMNAQQAFDALIGFFRAAYFKGQRTVLVVPGRGLNSPHGISILREKIQEWFTQDPLKRVILAFCTARPADGGAGALYVLLRKFRKGQGKICWERKPADPDLL